ATRFVYVEIVLKRDAKTIAACLERFLKAFGHPVHTILTDNGSKFTDRFAVDMKDKPEGKPSGRHPFDKLCAKKRIKHKLTPPVKPHTHASRRAPHPAVSPKLSTTGPPPAAMAVKTNSTAMTNGITSFSPSSMITIEQDSDASAISLRSKRWLISRDTRRWRT